MTNPHGLTHDLLVDVHADAYLSTTQLSERRWRIGVLIQPRPSATEHWWVAGGSLDVQLNAGPQVTAITASADAGGAGEPSLYVPNVIAKQMGYGEQTNATVRAELGGLTHVRFEFTVSPDVSPMVAVGQVNFQQAFDGRELHDASEFLTIIPFGTDEHRQIVLGQPHQEVWCTDEVLEPGEAADIYYVHAVNTLVGPGLPCGHDWCNGQGVIEEVPV